MMLGLSVQQPYASLIAVGAKRYETRGWRPTSALMASPAIDIAICAGRSKQGIRASMQCPLLRGLCLEKLGTLSLPMGAVVAVATVTTCVSVDGLAVSEQEQCCGDYAPGRWAWELLNVRALHEPVAVWGKLGLFQLPDDFEAVIREQVMP